MFMKSIFSYFCSIGALLVLGFMASGCSSTAYSLRSTNSPDAENEFFKNGLQYHVETQDQVKVALAFDTMRTQSQATFEAKVTNLGDQKFNFDANAFTCILSSKRDPSHSVTGAIIDPENEILSLQSQYESLNPNGWDTLARILDVVDATANISTPSSREQNRRNDEIQQREAQLDLADLQRQQKQAQVIAEIRFWRKNALRKTTLAKGKSVRGNIVCSFDQKTDFDQLNLSLSTQGKTFAYSFERFQIGAPSYPTAAPQPVIVAMKQSGKTDLGSQEFPEISAIADCNNFAPLARDRCREELIARNKK